LTALDALDRKRSNLIKRALILQKIRAFFIARSFLEVETPQRIPVNAPELWIDPVASEDGWLQTSPELAMKRLLAAGYEQIFQISHCWRKGERGTLHLPEFTLLEWYRSHSDYRQLMADCEALLFTLRPGSLKIGKRCVDLAPPWPRIPLEQLFAEHGRCSLAEAEKIGCFEEVLSEDIEPHLGFEKPVFVIDYPASMAALARIKPEQPHLAERFELYINGMEIANAFSELNNTEEQRTRFSAEEKARQALGKQPCPLPEPFLRDLEKMPPAAGIALGIDRLVMLLTGAAEIDEVVAFTPEIV